MFTHRRQQWRLTCGYRQPHEGQTGTFLGGGCGRRIAPPPSSFSYPTSSGRRNGLGKRGLRVNGNSGAGAINLAYHFGARRILLVGMDMKPGPNGEKHWHPDHPKPLVQASSSKSSGARRWGARRRPENRRCDGGQRTPWVGAHVLPDGRSGQELCEVSTAVLCIRPEPHYRCNAFTEGLKRLRLRHHPPAEP